MSVTMNKNDGVTVITVTSDPTCVWPPLCQIFEAICSNPLCCSVSQHLKRVQGTSQSALGATQIMVGVINIFLGIIVGSNDPDSWQFVEDWYPILLGLLFVAFGTMSILSERYPSPCLVIASVIVNLAGVGFAIAATTLYGFNYLRMRMSWLCQRNEWQYWLGELIQLSPNRSVEENIMIQKCEEARTMLRQAVFIFPAIMSVLEFCLVISSAVLGIKTLVRGQKEKNKHIDGPDLYKAPLLKEISTITA